MRYFDSHAHYFDSWFDEYEGGACALLEKLFADNVSGIVNVATNVDNLRECIAQAAKYDKMYVAAGIHPEDCLYIEDIDAALSEIERYISDDSERAANKIVAIGEIGFDYHVEGLNDGIKAKQKYVLESQMKMAEKYGIPVIIHDREAHGDCFDEVLKHPNVRGIFHSYSGSSEMARELVRRGWYISFSGVVTFKNAKRVREVVASVPHDRLLIETDAPYLAPHPNRGKMNHSGNLVYTCAAVAEALGITESEAACITEQNARKIFGI